MRDIVLGHDAYVSSWVMERLPIKFRNPDWGPFRSIGVSYNGQLVAGIVYNQWSEETGDLQMTIAASSPHWASRAILRVLFGYPFVTLGARRVTAVTNQRNKKTKSLLKRLGFQHEGCKRNLYGNEGALIYGMLRHECVWIKDTVNVGTIQHPQRT